METFQILSDQFSHFQHLFHRWLAIFCIISSYIFDLSSSPHTWGIPGSITWSQQWRTVHPHLRGAYGTPPRHAVQKQRFIPTCVGHTPAPPHPAPCRSVHPHMRRAYRFTAPFWASVPGSSPHTWGIRCRRLPPLCRCSVHPHIRGAYASFSVPLVALYGSSPHTWGIHWTAVRKMAGFSHFSYDFTRKSYFVQGLVFFGVIGAEAFPTHRRGRNQCLPGAHGGSVRNL